MSIEYSADFGIGYEILETAEHEDLLDFIDCETGEEFECFEPGNSFTGEMDGVFLVIKEPFSKGANLTWAKDALDAEVKRLDLETCGDFGEVGGLSVY